MRHWTQSSTFYHIYPLGFCDAPLENRGDETQGNHLGRVSLWLDAIQELGCDAIYFGPLFQSFRHGYDTSDYYQVDSRLGTNEDFAKLSEEIHHRGMRIVLDGVFNHVGRGFWAFRDLQQNGQRSNYRDWFVAVDFSRSSPKGDAFDYATWEGHYSLPKLNLHHLDVRQHLFDAVKMWMREFNIDGLRLDAADCVEPFFWKELRSVTKAENQDFWLMGEIIHGDYRGWANDEMFDSVTNYTAYKGLWSSLNDANFFEIAYTLDQQFDLHSGKLSHLWLYNFVDNHDVSRVASLIRHPALLFPLYLMLFTIPGIPSIYYGSEFGVQGRKEDGDFALRRAYDLMELQHRNSSLRDAIQRISAIRKASPALQSGVYQKLLVKPQQFVYLRRSQEETIVVLLNASTETAAVNFPVPASSSGEVWDILNEEELPPIQQGEMACEIPPTWGRIMRLR